MSGALLQSGLGCIFQPPVIQKLAAQGSIKALKILKTHFLDGSHVLGEGFQKSYDAAMLASASGMLP